MRYLIILFLLLSSVSYAGQTDFADYTAGDWYVCDEGAGIITWISEDKREMSFNVYIEKEEDLTYQEQYYKTKVTEFKKGGEKRQ